MIETRLKTYIWVQIQQLRCTQLNLPIYVLHKGDESGGAAIIKIVLLNGLCRVFSQMRRADGAPAWQSRSEGNKPLEEEEANNYIARRLKSDPDLWVLEIEDPSGLYELDHEIV